MTDEDIREGEPDPRRQRNDADYDVDPDDWRLQNIRKQSEDADIAKQFRDQIVALGVMWILVLGIIAGAAATMVTDLPVRAPSPVAIYTGATAVIWIVLGVLACLKQVWAVYTGLVLGYVTIAISIVGVFTGTIEGAGGCFCSFAAIGVSNLQAHRVIGWARKMRAAGIPLSGRRE
jgi:hypothetical protein